MRAAKFEEIWDEVLETTGGQASEFYIDTAREPSLLEGTRRGWSRVYSRFCNLFGAPNHGAAGWAQCLWPRLVDCNLTFGGAQYMEAFDFPNTHCILAWGVNPTSWGCAPPILWMRECGAALLVIDPQLSETAAKADLYCSRVRHRYGACTCYDTGHYFRKSDGRPVCSRMDGRL